jgi:hypothetical protein
MLVKTPAELLQSHSVPLTNEKLEGQEDILVPRGTG